MYVRSSVGLNKESLKSRRVTSRQPPDSQLLMGADQRELAPHPPPLGVLADLDLLLHATKAISTILWEVLLLWLASFWLASFLRAFNSLKRRALLSPRVLYFFIFCERVSFMSRVVVEVWWIQVL